MAFIDALQHYFQNTISDPDVTSAPPVPYVSPLNPLSHGYRITITGQVLPNANRFHVNLSMGDKPDEPHSTAFHFNPRFNEGLVVRNSFLNNGWGGEERDGPKMYLQPDQQFELVILVTDTCYKAALNGQHFCDYDHRVAKEDVNCLAIHGDVMLHQIQLSDPRKPATLPFEQCVPYGAVTGTVVRIHGIPKMDADRFAINFLTDDKEDIAFHFNPRFGGQVVVRNTKEDGVWGTEEREQPTFPFVRGQEFKVIIFSDPEKFQVIVNNENFVTYNHRIKNLKKIIFIQIVGDLDLYSVQL